MHILCEASQVVPVHGCEYWQPRQQIIIATKSGRFTILHSDRFNGSDSTVLKIFRKETEMQIPWSNITDVKPAEAIDA